MKVIIMKLYKISLALLLGVAAMSSCSDKLNVSDPNRQTSETFGNTASDLEECIVACYNHIRMEGTYARVGYNIDVCRGDEVWNSSQVWYLPFDDLNEPVTDEIGQWSWRDWYYTINVCNFVLSRVEGDNATLSERYNTKQELQIMYNNNLTVTRDKLPDAKKRLEDYKKAQEEKKKAAAETTKVTTKATAATAKPNA